MCFLGLEAETHLDVRSCIMDANPESSSLGHNSRVIFMASICSALIWITTIGGGGGGRFKAHMMFSCMFLFLFPLDWRILIKQIS